VRPRRGRQVRSASAGIVCSTRRPACAPWDRLQVTALVRRSRGAGREKRGQSWVIGTYVSRYDQRIKLVAATLTAHSKLTEKAAIELARHVMYALDHIPEKVR
jgi:hypothetical protein